MSHNSAINYRLLDPKTVLLGGGDGESLENVIIDPLPNGALCFVNDQDAVYRLAKFALTAVSAPDVIATSRGAGVPGRWVKITGTSAGGGIEVLAANASELPFDLPNTGEFGTPTGLSVTFGPSVTGDMFVVQVWAETVNESLSTQAIQGQITLDAVSVFDSQISHEVAVNANTFAPLQYVVTLLADNPAPVFSAGYRAFGAGVDLTAASISVTKIPA